MAKDSPALARQGYVLINKKRNILIWELMELIDQAKDIQSEIDVTFREAYLTLRMVNTELSINYIQEIGASISIETGVRIKTRSIMGTEIPLIQHEKVPISLTYACYSTRKSLDETRARLEKVKELTVKLSIVESPAYRLTSNAKEAQKCVNVLKNIMIPMYGTLAKNISNALEEKEREEFTRLKIIKRDGTEAG